MNKNSDEVREIFYNNANNSEFFELLGGEVYGAPFDHAVMLRLEEAAQDDSVTKTFSGHLTIEHVLPKMMKDIYWTSRFREDDYNLWLNRLGNLVMLSGRKNSRAQYYSFDKKKTIYNEMNKTVSFDLTKEVCNLDEWNPCKLKPVKNASWDLPSKFGPSADLRLVASARRASLGGARFFVRQSFNPPAST